jgi:hypothetical protein
VRAPHDPQHTAQLEGLLSGAADPRAEFARSELAGCAACAEELEALLDAMERLDALADDAREAVAAGRAEGPAPGEARIEEFVRAQMRPAEPARSGPAVRRWWPLALAGAAALAVYATWPREAPPPPDPGPVLNAGAIALEHPVGSVGEWLGFRWRAELPAGGWFRVRVRAQAAGPVLIESPELHELQWLPAPEVLSRLPRAIHWEVVAFDDSGQPSEPAWASASLR